MEGILRKFSSLFRGDSRETFGAVAERELAEDYFTEMEGREISEEGFLHRPVLLREVVENLNLNPGKVVVDCTVGTGGHAEAILERILPGGFLLGIDLDKGSILFTEKRLNKYGNSFRLIQNNFREIKAIMEETGIEKADGFLLDLGVSSYQLNDPQRGFSFRFASPLDMRMNLEQKLRAFDLVNHLDEYTLIKILENNAQERFARRIAHEIISARKIKNIENTTELVEIVLRAIPRKYHYAHIHPATRTFQALRIAVNNELDNLAYFLDNFLDLLSLKGRIAVISFHSLEDRLVKNKFRQLVKEGRLRILTPKPIRPTPEEKNENPRSRSARLRIGERLR